MSSTSRTALNGLHDEASLNVLVLLVSKLAMDRYGKHPSKRMIRRVLEIIGSMAQSLNQPDHEENNNGDSFISAVAAVLQESSNHINEVPLIWL